MFLRHSASEKNLFGVMGVSFALLDMLYYVIN